MLHFKVELKARNRRSWDKGIPRIIALWLCCCVASFGQAIPLAKAVGDGKARVEFEGNGRDSATLKVMNTSSGPLAILLVAGSLLEAKTAERQVTLRTFETRLEAGVSAEVALPTAALGTKQTKAERTLDLIAGTEPRLVPLLKLFENHNDLPRGTAQLAVFIVLEDIQWPAWRAWSAEVAGKPLPESPTPAGVEQAVDALALVRLAEPDRKPALPASEELKRLALRNPRTRAKAMALYGLTVENALTGDQALPPDLKHLLHESPNDNCTVCRLRKRMDANVP